MEELVLQKLQTIWPELIMLIGAVLCLFVGLAPRPGVRSSTPWLAGATLLLAGLAVPATEPISGLGLAGMTQYVKLAVVGVGLLLLLVASYVPDQLQQVRRTEQASAFEPGENVRGEFFAFFLFSLTGVMLTAGADDLVWLFLALELTSLPTYIMVATGRENLAARESAVKYFFLGAMSAAVFLYGFTLIYGATGFTDFGQIHALLQSQQQISPLMLTGLTLSIAGIAFKIAGFPMHFYAADVYEGAESAVTAFLAFVPKTAGFAALILLLGLVGWPLDRTPEVFGAGDALIYLLWGLAAVTMTLGNVLALLQENVKRVLAYSSIAHSGYLLVGLLAGTGYADGGAMSNGVAAILFYLVAYGLATIAGFAVLGCLQARQAEAQTYDDIAGLSRRHPVLAGVLLLSMLSLIGLPPLIGFFGKIYLIGSVFGAGFNLLVVILVLNSAVSAAYYLRIAGTAFFGAPAEHVRARPAPARFAGAFVAGVTALLLGMPGGLGASLADYAQQATASAQGPTPGQQPAKQDAAEEQTDTPAAELTSAEN
jgi:NADH-quinone oxidoreductase subunit N